MLRKTLLATTALVLCASLSLAGQNGALPKNRAAALATMLRHAAVVHPGARGSQPVHNAPPNLEDAIFSNYSKYPNAQFISWFGYRVENESSCYSSGTYFSCFHTIAENALAFTPAATVTTKSVTVPMYGSSTDYQVDIYSSVGGLPGVVIAKSGKFAASGGSPCCTTVPIKANLTGGSQYFIGIVGICCNANGGWSMEDTDFSGAAVDYYRFKTHATYNFGTGTHTSSHSSPWHASTHYPTTGAVVLK